MKNKREQLIRLASAICGGLGGLLFIPLLNVDFFLPAGADKLGLHYAAFSLVFSTAFAWLITSPKNLKQAMATVACAICIAGVPALGLLYLHPNSRFNEFGTFDL